MNRRLWCAMFALVSFWLASPAAASNSDARPLRVSIFSGATEYNSDQSLAAFAKYLESHENVRYTLNLMKDIHDFPGIDQLETCDVMVLYVRRMQLPPDQIQKIQKYFESGKPVVGIRTASHAFQPWLEFDHLVLGGDYHGHGTDKLARIEVNPKAADHPVLGGLRPFETTGKLYNNAHLAEDVKVLLRATTEDGSQPVAWVRLRGPQKKQRVFYTSLGTPADFQQESFRKLLANAVLWAGGRQPNDNK